MSSWIYELVDTNDSSQSAALVADDIANKMSKLSDDQVATAKIGISDQHHGPAWGVLFYDTRAKPMVGALDGAWKVYTRTFGSNNEYEDNCKAIVDVLNGSPNTVPDEGEPSPPSLSDAQASTAKFAMSDYDGGICHMMLFYQLDGIEESDPWG